MGALAFVDAAEHTQTCELPTIEKLLDVSSFRVVILRQHRLLTLNEVELP
jgi:hypothetical protein